MGKMIVHSIDQVLHQVAQDDAVPYIVAEIPTNPRVEVPDLLELKKVLAKKRLTRSGAKAPNQCSFWTKHFVQIFTF